MELIQVWLLIIGLGTVAYGLLRLGMWIYEQDRQMHPSNPLFPPYSSYYDPQKKVWRPKSKRRAYFLWS